MINVSIANYDLIHADSPTNAEGVPIYISTQYKFEIEHDLDMKLTGSEELWVKLLLNDVNSTQFILGAVYRHPNSSTKSIEVFSEALQNTIDKITKCNNTFYLLGDFNIDIFPQKKKVGSLIYVHHLISSASFPIITIQLE